MLLTVQVTEVGVLGFYLGDSVFVVCFLTMNREGNFKFKIL